MGGRGRSSGANPAQLRIDRMNYRQETIEMREKTSVFRDTGLGFGVGAGSGQSSSGFGSQVVEIECACCGIIYVFIQGQEPVCHACGWIHDKFQNANPDSRTGKNPFSLNEKREMIATLLSKPES